MNAWTLIGTFPMGGVAAEAKVAKASISIADDAFVHVTPTSSVNSIMENGLDPAYSNGKSFVTRWGSIKNIANPRDFNTILYRQNLWEEMMTNGKFNHGATILRIDAEPTFFSPRTNWVNGVPQYIFTEPISPKFITPIISF